MKELVKQLLILFVSALFTRIANKYPTFPLDKESFINFFLWLFAIWGIIEGLRLKIYLLGTRTFGKSKIFQ